MRTSVDKLSEVLALMFYAGKYEDKIKKEPDADKAHKDMIEFSELHANEFKSQAIKVLDAI